MERQEAERDMTVVSGLSGATAFFVVPKNIFKEKTEAFLLPLWEWFGMLIGAKKAVYELTTLAFLWPVTPHCVYFRTWDLHWVNINREQNLKPSQFAFASEVFLYLLNFNCFYSRKKNVFLAFSSMLLYRKLITIFKPFYLAHQLVIFSFIINVFLYCHFP